MKSCVRHRECLKELRPPELRPPDRVHVYFPRRGVSGPPRSTRGRDASRAAASPQAVPKPVRFEKASLGYGAFSAARRLRPASFDARTRRVPRRGVAASRPQANCVLRGVVSARRAPRARSARRNRPRTRRSVARRRGRFRATRAARRSPRPRRRRLAVVLQAPHWSFSASLRDGVLPARRRMNRSSCMTRLGRRDALLRSCVAASPACGGAGRPVELLFVQPFRLASAAGSASASEKNDLVAFCYFDAKPLRQP